MKTEILHRSDCSQHNEPYKENEPCDCSPIYTIQPLSEKAIDVANESPREHESQTDERIDHFISGGEYVINNAIDILKLKMNQDNSLSATEYWYRCGIHDAIELLKQFNPTTQIKPNDTHL